PGVPGEAAARLRGGHRRLGVRFRRSRRVGAGGDRVGRAGDRRGGGDALYGARGWTAAFDGAARAAGTAGDGGPVVSEGRGRGDEGEGETEGEPCNDSPRGCRTRKRNYTRHGGPLWHNFQPQKVPPPLNTFVAIHSPRTVRLASANDYI